MSRRARDDPTREAGAHAVRIAMVETGGWGGIAHYAWSLCAALGDAGADVTLLTNVAYELDGRPGRFAVEHCFSAGAGFVGNVRALSARLRRGRADVVHVQSLVSTRLDALLWPLVRRRVPTVMTVHNVRSHEGIRWDDWTLWRCLAAATAVVVHTEEALGEARRRLGPRTRIELIRMGDWALFRGAPPGDRGAARARLGLPPDAGVVLAFGAIRPYKGLSGVIAALPALRRRHPGARLVIVGPLLAGGEGEYREAIRLAGVEDAVVFRPGYVPGEEVPGYFAAADVAVFNYRGITDSGSLRLACHMGTPVVATAVGGFSEFLTDGVTGRLVPAGDDAALAAALADVLADPAGARRMAEAAAALARSAWSWADSAKATLALYGAVTGGAS
jgi:glycosyltransferase involved in cell wall biosynthesis